MKETGSRPPQFAVWLLRQIFSSEMFDEVSGDLQELYENRMAKRGKWNASCHYLLDVVLSVRNRNLRRGKKVKQAGSLMESHFRMAGRTLRRQRGYSFLNILGLALSMAAFLFIDLYVSHEKSYDRFHAQHNDLFRVSYSFQYFIDKVQHQSATSPPRIASFIKESMPEVSGTARARLYKGLVISNGDNKFREDGVLIADPSFLQLFTFPMVEGNAGTALNQIRTIALSERARTRYFGNGPALGKVLALDGDERYTVTAVFKDVPENSHLKFDFLLSYETIKWWTEGGAETSWWFNDYYTYVLLPSGTDVAAFEKKLDEKFQRERGKINREEGSRQEFHLQPVTDIHLYSKLDFEAVPGDMGDSQSVFFLTLIGFAILVIGWINYINLTTARTIVRAKEVGLRKTLGAHSLQLIHQFLVESFTMNFLALTFSVAVIIGCLSVFNDWTQASLAFEFLSSIRFWGQVMTLLAAGTLLAGLYPAMVIASYHPAVILKGRVYSKGSGVSLRRGLVIFQFAASVTLISATWIIFQQLQFMKNSSLGFDKAQVIVVRGPSPREDELTKDFRQRNLTFLEELSHIPGILSATGGSTVPGQAVESVVVLKKKEDPESRFITVQSAWIGYDYFSTLGIKILAGRTFNPAFKSDTAAVILNAAAAKELGFPSAQAAIGQWVSVGVELFWPVIGVVDDFHQVSVKSAVKPTFFSLYTGYSTFYAVRFSGRDYATVQTGAKKLYESLYPRAPFDYFFLEDSINQQYRNEMKLSRVFTLFAGLAILVSCLGLLGLSSFSALQRTREIGVRKVLGADISNIVFLLSREFLGLVLVGNVIAWPFAYLVMNDWLKNFADHITIGISLFLISGVAIMTLAALTVAYQTVMTARSNPVQALRHQ